MDYAFSGGNPSDAVFQYFSDFYDNRPNTKHLKTLNAFGAPSLEGLVSDLNDLSQADKPIGDVFIGSHGNESGWLKIRLTSILPIQEVDYDTLSKYGGRLRLDPKTTTPASAGQPGTTIHFRACRIGQADPFMQLLKKSFGGNVRVSAAKHFFEYYEITIGPDVTFVIEYLAYSFIISLPKNKALSSRSDVVKAFKNFKYPDTSEPFKYFDGTAIPDAKWNEWVPPKAPKHKAQKPINFSLKAGGRVFTFNTEFRNEPDQAPDAIPYSGPKLDKNQDKAQELALAHLQTLPQYQASAGNPYPVYQRNGFADLSSFVNGHFWRKTTVKGTDALVGERIDYTLQVPIFDPVNDLILHNLMPVTSNAETPAQHNGLDETNTNLFWNQ